MTSTQIVSDPYGDYERSYNVEMLQVAMFGAFISAIQYRRDNVSMTNVQIAERGGWSRSQISKQLSGPQNWTLKTIAELSTALDLDFKFALIDKTDTTRVFDAAGLCFNFGSSNGAVNSINGNNTYSNIQDINNNTSNSYDVYSSGSNPLGTKISSFQITNQSQSKVSHR